MAQHEVFLTGGTGFLGRSLAAELLRRGHRVRALVRPGSGSRIVQGCQVVHGDALRAETYAASIGAADTFVHLVGVANPVRVKPKSFVASILCRAGKLCRPQSRQAFGTLSISAWPARRP
jgi:nucleoside-diphosphate-sugar epimerase